MPTTERKIRYDREHSLTENKYRVFSGHAVLPLVCVVCGAGFKASACTARFCSERCRNDKHMADRKRARHKRRAAVSAVCSCGAAIQLSPAGRLPRHCSCACRQRAYRNNHAKNNVDKKSALNT